MPVNSFKLLNESKFKDTILNKTPLLSSLVDKSVDIFSEFEELKNKYNDDTNDEFNNEAVDLMLKYNIVSIDTINKLIDDKKIEVDKEIIEKYKEE